eukprot:6786154-Pyramimonas_sp.AAC.1
MQSRMPGAHGEPLQLVHYRARKGVGGGHVDGAGEHPGSKGFADEQAVPHDKRARGVGHIAPVRGEEIRKRDHEVINKPVLGRHSHQPHEDGHKAREGGKDRNCNIRHPSAEAVEAVSDHPAGAAPRCGRQPAAAEYVDHLATVAAGSSAAVGAPC